MSQAGSPEVYPEETAVGKGHVFLSPLHIQPALRFMHLGPVGLTCGQEREIPQEPDSGTYEEARRGPDCEQSTHVGLPF
ncbi:rCG63503 [Rattus norvegicus]|uniref:RCG63503 n=1 Tax=Rattus norvegicus TaxID=10116 RepID=A6HLB6_RAT|nr:rCG63503 [Rattus norvegicus]